VCHWFCSVSFFVFDSVKTNEVTWHTHTHTHLSIHLSCYLSIFILPPPTPPIFLFLRILPLLLSSSSSPPPILLLLLSSSSSPPPPIFLIFLLSSSSRLPPPPPLSARWIHFQRASIYDEFVSAVFVPIDFPVGRRWRPRPPKGFRRFINVELDTQNHLEIKSKCIGFSD